MRPIDKETIQKYDYEFRSADAIGVTVAGSEVYGITARHNVGQNFSLGIQVFGPNTNDPVLWTRTQGVPHWFETGAPAHDPPYVSKLIGLSEFERLIA